MLLLLNRERSGSLVECFTRGRGFKPHRYPSLVLVQPRKTWPCLTEIFLMGRKESNQTNKSFYSELSHLIQLLAVV